MIFVILWMPLTSALWRCLLMTRWWPLRCWRSKVILIKTPPVPSWMVIAVREATFCPNRSLCILVLKRARQRAMRGLYALPCIRRYAVVGWAHRSFRLF